MRWSTASLAVQQSEQMEIAYEYGLEVHVCMLSNHDRQHKGLPKSTHPLMLSLVIDGSVCFRDGSGEWVWAFLLCVRQHLIAGGCDVTLICDAKANLKQYAVRPQAYQQWAPSITASIHGYMDIMNQVPVFECRGY